MNEEKLTELVINISTGLAELNANMKSVLNTLTQHESRLTRLEEGRLGVKDTTIQWLLKGLIASVFTIGSLTGAGSLLKQIFAQ